MTPFLFHYGILNCHSRYFYITKYNLLKSSVEKIAINMLNKGVLKGEKVALILSNRIEYILSYFALFYIGALPVPLNTRWEKQEVFNVLQDSESRFIICEEKVGNIVFGKYIIEYIATFDSIEKVFYFGSNLYGSIGIPFKSLTDESSQDGVALETLDPDSPAMISYTSGTTGIPKGVVLKHNDIVKISKYTGAIWADEDDLPFSIAPLYSAQGFLSLFINFATEKCFTMIASFNPNDNPAYHVDPAAELPDH
ncbi:MAG: class I adenylate-forming enzyme family protein [Desulfobacterales bacterium]|nr:class I adenylate-forming enzyme family protein [Desulfobacterales bacterium]HHY31257.1 acyl--CoA ligase [Syntrophaceticus sp.]